MTLATLGGSLQRGGSRARGLPVAVAKGAASPATARPPRPAGTPPPPEPQRGKAATRLPETCVFGQRLRCHWRGGLWRQTCGIAAPREHVPPPAFRGRAGRGARPPVAQTCLVSDLSPRRRAPASHGTGVWVTLEPAALRRVFPDAARVWVSHCHHDAAVRRVACAPLVPLVLRGFFPSSGASPRSRTVASPHIAGRL